MFSAGDEDTSGCWPLSFLIIIFDWNFYALALVRIYSLAPESIRDLNSQVLDCLSFLTSRMNSLTKIIGLKCTCFGLLLDLVFLPFLLVGLRRMFNMWASCNALYNLLEIIVCSLIFDLLLGFNLSMIIASLQPLHQLLSSFPMELLLLSSSSSSEESES